MPPLLTNLLPIFVLVLVWLLIVNPRSHRWERQGTILYDFPDCAEGCAPTETLVFDKAGNLYGSGPGGNNGCGPYSCGVVFKLTP